MDTSSLPLLNYDLQYQWCSDSDLSSISSPESLSPVHSMDSSLSPPDHLGSSPHSLSGRGRKSGRAPRIRSKQRQSASEKEKLRMRVLTKAMHHLRSYLPPSVAPAGQTLTKIETLRLTIRYISFLSAQLGLSEEVLFQQRREQGDPSASDTSSPDIHSYLQAGNTGGPEPQLQNQSPGQSLYPEQCYNHNAMVHHGSCSFRVDQYNGHYSGAAQGDVSVDAILQSPPSTQASYQMYGHDFSLPLASRDYWC
uniref:Mesoderm posterior ba n=1 Tax=Cynoglossus semilaevis TaxID=244447 RepID=A0A3P8VQX5_CYNSE